MDRRKTLGGLSPGQLNVRASFCPARVNKEAEKSNAWGTKIPVEKALSRLSIAGTVRRSSAHTVKGAGPWNDPRPIKDPAFQHKCAQAIIEYLATHKYEHQVAPKMLSSISTKDFTNIMTFLLRQLDPTLARSPTLKLEEEVPALFSRLHYPIKISRSSLTAVGSPHTWPGILAALAWLVELLGYAARAEQVRSQGRGASAEADFFEHCQRLYGAFMRDDRAESEALQRAKEEEFAGVSRAAQEEARGLAEENGRLGAVLAERRARPSALLAARARLEETRADRDKFRRLVESLEAHKAGLERKAAARRADVSAASSAAQAAEAACAALRAAVSAQPLQPADALRLQGERAAAEGELRALRDARAAAEARGTGAERGAQRALAGAEEACLAYQARAEALKLIPACSKRAQGVVFGVQLDRAATSVADMLRGVDLKNQARPAAERLAERYRARAAELQAERPALEERRDAAREAAAERAAECEALRRRAEEGEAALARGRAGLESALDESAGAARELAGEAQGLRARAEEGGEAAKKAGARVQALQLELEAAARAQADEGERLHAGLAAALDALLAHKRAVRQAIDAARKRVGA